MFKYGWWREMSHLHIISCCGCSSYSSIMIPECHHYAINCFQIPTLANGMLPWIISISNELDITIHVIVSQLSGHCDVISNQLWHHQQNKNWASETQGWCVKIVIVSAIYGFIMLCKKWNIVCSLALTQVLFSHTAINLYEYKIQRENKFAIKQ